jgi:putative ABC transport system permease protein
MLKSYFKIAWRNLRKNKLYTFVNLAGLTIGITSCILIGLYIAHEFSYDRFNTNADRIARVTMEYGQGGTVEKAATTGTKVGPQFQRSFPAIRAFARTMKYVDLVRYGDKVFDERNVLYADSAFFRIFSFPLLKGDPATALNAPYQVVISESMAKKYFGDQYPIGKTLKFDNDKDYTVTGVARDIPDNSQITFDFAASFSSLHASKTEDWWTANYVTYLLLDRPGDLPSLQRQVTDLMKTEQVRKEAELTGSNYLTYSLEPLTQVHLHSTLTGLRPNGSITYIFILAAIAILILVIACVNYTNLATAQSEGRKGEISVRKVLGAQRGQLFGQYIGESLLLTFIALILATLISIELLPVFNQLADKSLSASSLLQPLPIGVLLLLGLVVSLLAGAYPAFVLSNTRLINILKSGFRLSSSGGNFRRSLIVFQFVISVFLMISTMIIMQQLSFIQHKKLGYDKENIIVLPIDEQVMKNYDDFKNAIARDPQVISIGGAGQKPTFVQWTDGLRPASSPAGKDITIKGIPADIDFATTMGMRILAGSAFDRADMYKMDTSDGYKHFQYTFMLNESAVRALGWTPETAVGKMVKKGEVPGIVKAVVQDFHFASMHQPITPLMIFLSNEYISALFVKVSGKDMQGTLNNLQAIWKQRAPWRPFEYHFLDEDYNALYKTETRTGQVFSTFAITAILLACLGLFALAAFTTVQRTKEIGIRKVLGASVTSITGLLSGDFLKLVGIAAIIAFPISWWAMHQWLEGFAYRIPISWWVFAAAGLLSMLVALVTVSFQAIRAALANPVESLRSE